MGFPVVQFEIEGLDGEALGSFYSELFGWKLSPAPGNPAYQLVAPEQGRHRTGLGGAISSVPERPSSTWRGPTRAEGYGGHVTVYVEVPDIDAALAEAERLGGTRMQGPDEIEGAGVTIAKFNDPEGNLIGLVCPS
jgi:uncharacterized protein